MSSFSIKEFRPTILFLLKFVGLYIVSNILYGLYITAYHPKPDPATHFVTNQCAEILSMTESSVNISDHKTKPNTLITHENKPVLSVYEGCNGINTMLVFLSFLFAFGPISKKMLWFIPLGILLIHLVNLGRIILLFQVAEELPQYMYFTHKYLFTSILYAVIFGLWVLWVKKYSIQSEGK